MRLFTVLAAAGNSEWRETLCASLERGGYRCYPAETGEKALFLFDCFHIDVLVADRSLPGTDGCALTEELRAAGYALPVLLLTDEDRLEEKRRCFLSGADDCMVRPRASTDEVLLRVGALLRRAREASGHRLTLGNVVIDYDSLTVTTPERAVLLPKKEMYVLFKLLSAPSRTFTRQQLVEELWGLAAQVDERTIDVHVKRLREKFRDRPEFKIVTVRGVGYRAQVPGQRAAARHFA